MNGTVLSEWGAQPKGGGFKLVWDGNKKSHPQTGFEGATHRANIQAIRRPCLTCSQVSVLSAAECFVRFAQIVDQITGDNAALSKLIGRQIAGQSVDIDADHGRINSTHSLRQE